MTLIRMGCLAALTVYASWVTPAESSSPSAMEVSAGPHDTGLPELPDASGSPRAGGTYEMLPKQLYPILQYLKCDISQPRRVLVHRTLGLEKRTDYMVTDRPGPDYSYWLRTFAGIGGTTGYLVQLQGCPAHTKGMRALVAKAGEAPQDVTAAILAGGGYPDNKAMQKYIRQGASGLFALTHQLDRVPTVRWVSEVDPDQPLKRDARLYDGRSLVHGAFLIWAGDHFEVRQKVKLAQWHCGGKGYVPCKDDPFVELP